MIHILQRAIETFVRECQKALITMLKERGALDFTKTL